MRKPVLVAADLAAHPVEAWTRIQDTCADRRERRGPQCRYESDEDWEHRIHDWLGVPWPCTFSSEFWALWKQVIGELETKGIRPGPESFKYWNDGDAGLVRSIWCLTRHLSPNNVVETGVGHGVTSRIILEALEANGYGHLWSIDLPPLERDWRKQVGIAIGNGHVERWSYIKGSSRLHLPNLISQLEDVDLFVHDSLHSERNVRFELDCAWAALRPGGALVVDDVDANWGFQSFTQTHSGYRSIVCEAEPIRPDLRRSNKKGMFGIILNAPTARVEPRIQEGATQNIRSFKIR